MIDWIVQCGVDVIAERVHRVRCGVDDPAEAGHRAIASSTSVVSSSVAPAASARMCLNRPQPSRRPSSRARAAVWLRLAVPSFR